ncbi:DUF6268 family outer membrane beta-barrel protein [Planctomyces sp. SH-PL14]|uniref:DUF6268 family outer membrane beta-barrel protein n=1 Tax=Planctomyces sp. SH-PL14 TaxID=1632864 RepID=UPI0012E724BC|nr:DUF6268 family outer membrane beta-barrel protein [Planctomyces sp. SH-PL14]
MAETDGSSASTDLPDFGHSPESTEETTEETEPGDDAPPDSVAFGGNDGPLASPGQEPGPLVGPGEPGPFSLRWLRNPFAPYHPAPVPQRGGFFDPMDQLTDSDGRPPGIDGPDGPGGPGGPDGGPDGGPPGGFGGQDEPGYAATWYPSAAVAGQGTELGVFHQRLGVDVPLWFQGADALMMSLSVDETHFSGRATLPDTQRAFPSDLWNIQVGLKHIHQYANGWTSMLMFDVGSASDKPFQAVRDVSVQLGGFLIIPARNERDSWMLGVLYSPLGSPSFPIPLISYHWKPSDTFEMNIGLPSNLKWQATDRLSFDLSYFPILSIDALATYKLTEQLHLYGGYQNISRSWFLADRVHRNDQFFANERRLSYDDRGRVVEQVQNYQESLSSSSSSSGGGCSGSDDINVTVQTSYNADGNVATLTAVNSQTGNQVTTYVYGTTLDTSDIATSMLKRKEIYPDSEDDDDVITFRYNRQSQVTTRTDQNGTVHAYDYDRQGRMVQDRVTTLGAGVDGAVRRIGTTYDIRGLRHKITSYDNPTVGAGTVLNEVLSEYNDFSQLVTEYQAHEGAVNTSTTPNVQYSYANGSNNTIRPLTLVYPNGRTLTYDYGAANEMSDAASRIEAIVDDDDTRLVEYSYLGRGTFVVADDTEPQVKWTLVDLDGDDDPDTGDIYSGLDRFGRVKDNRWYNYDAEEDVDRLQYGYDRASNRLWRKNLAATALGKEFDELYSYDGTHRLKDMGRGLLNGTNTALTSQTFAQCWTLDTTGNWSGMKEADTGGAWTLEQTRTASEVNEITGITNTVGSAWAQAVYDRAGSMTEMPQPKTPTDAYQATYDAWNRMTKIADDEEVVSEYQYDGRRFRIVTIEAPEMPPSSSSSSLPAYITRHAYFTARWQSIEERVEPFTTAVRHHVWSIQYIDALILQDFGDNGAETFAERLYGSQSVEWDTCGLFDATGEVRERFAYCQYGSIDVLTPEFAPRLFLQPSWNTLFRGYSLDRITDLYSVRHRNYSTALGGWLQRDPLTYTDGTSLYRAYFVPSDVDPFGLAKNICTRATTPTEGAWGSFRSVGATGTVQLAGVVDRPGVLTQGEAAATQIGCVAERKVTAEYICHPCCWRTPPKGNRVTLTRMQHSRMYPIAVGLEADIFVEGASVGIPVPGLPQGVPGPGITVFEHFADRGQINADAKCGTVNKGIIVPLEPTLQLLPGTMSCTAGSDNLTPEYPAMEIPQ